jgi:hypothetical protein
MSSPKRTAKHAIRRAANSVSRARAVPPAAKATVTSLDGDVADAKRLTMAIERGITDGRLDVLTAEALQKLIAAACRLYAARREAGEQLTPVPKNSLAATDVMATASGLLQAANLAVFELGMWQGWTGR